MTELMTEQVVFVLPKEDSEIALFLGIDPKIIHQHIGIRSLMCANCDPGS